MANSISSVTTGTGGIVLESVDTSGNTNIKSGTTTIVAVTSTGAAVTGTLSSTGNTTLGDASTDTLNVGNGGLVKDASGNVGIGTSSPAYKLDVRGIAVAGNGTIQTGFSYDTGGLVGTFTNHALGFITNSAVVARFDTSGNLGLGVTPSAWISSMRALQFGSQGSIYQGSANQVGFGKNAYTNTSNSATYITSDYATEYDQYNGTHRWFTAPSGTAGNPITFTQAMTLDASGNLGVGTTGGASANNTNSFSAIPASGGGYILVQHASGSASGFPYAYFGYNTSVIGSITQNGTTAVAYNTTSDYRLKTDVLPIQNALQTITALNPVSFNWIDGRPDDGFLAHELQVVLPNCITGEKDAVNEDGTPKYQQMDNSGVVPFLVKAIQEQQALITSLTARLDEQQAQISVLQGAK